jgi:hypothetical protein
MTTVELSSARDPKYSSTTSGPKEEYMAILFSARNISDDVTRVLSSVSKDDWRPVLNSADFSMNGLIPPLFSGIGVILAYETGKIHLISSDGKSAVSLNNDKGVITNFDFRKSDVKLTISVNRKHKNMSVYVYDGKTQNIRASIITENIPAEGYMGITGFSGSEAPMRVTVSKIRTTNLDFKSGIGEGRGSNIVGEKHAIDLTDLLHDDDEEIDDPVQQIQDIRKATSILSEYLADSRYRDTTLVRTISDIQGRAQSLHDSIRDLLAEIQISFKQRGSGSGGQGLLGEIKSLEELIRLHAEENESLEVLKENIKELSEAGNGYGHDPSAVDRISVANKELEEEVARANFTSNLVIGLFGVTVMGIGVLMYMKMRQYEKKHFL